MTRALMTRQWLLDGLASATFARLAWQYGPDRASLIMDGKDPKTKADIMAWRHLGARDVA
jgi:hypothetical protein